jgi:TonB family protein
MTGGNDRAPVPQIRIEPDYPVQQKDRGIEGWVTFQFTVAANGSVKDVVILASDPPRVWDATTIRAVSTWKYQPATKDGRPVEQVGLRATYRFELER